MVVNYGSLGRWVQEIKTVENTFDDLSREVIIGEFRRRLGPTAWEILALLRKRQNQPVSADSIRIVVYDGEDITLNNLHAQIFKLRQALRGSPYKIINFFGDGYQLVRDKEAR